MKKVIVLILIILLSACSVINKQEPIKKEIAPRTYEIKELFSGDFKKYDEKISSFFTLSISEEKIFVELTVHNKYYKETNGEDFVFNGLNTSETKEIGYLDLKDGSYHTILEFKDQYLRIVDFEYYNGAYLYRTISLDADNKGRHQIRTYYFKDGVTTELEKGKNPILLLFPRFTRYGNKVFFLTPDANIEGSYGKINEFNLETGENKILKEYMLDDEPHRGHELFIRLHLQKGTSGIHYATYKDGDFSNYIINPETSEITKIETKDRAVELIENNNLQLIKYLDEQDIWQYGVYDKEKKKFMVDKWSNIEYGYQTIVDGENIYFYGKAYINNNERKRGIFEINPDSKLKNIYNIGEYDAGIFIDYIEFNENKNIIIFEKIDDFTNFRVQELIINRTFEK